MLDKRNIFISNATSDELRPLIQKLRTQNNKLILTDSDHVALDQLMSECQEDEQADCIEFIQDIKKEIDWNYILEEIPSEYKPLDVVVNHYPIDLTNLDLDHLTYHEYEERMTHLIWSTLLCLRTSKSTLTKDGRLIQYIDLINSESSPILMSFIIGALVGSIDGMQSYLEENQHISFIFNVEPVEQFNHLKAKHYASFEEAISEIDNVEVGFIY